MPLINKIIKFVTASALGTLLYFSPAIGQKTYSDLASQQAQQIKKDSIDTQNELEKKYRQFKTEADTAYIEFSNMKAGLESFVVDQVKDGKFSDNERVLLEADYGQLSYQKDLLLGYDSMYTLDQKKSITYDTTLLNKIHKFNSEKDTSAITNYFAEKGINVEVTKYNNDAEAIFDTLLFGITFLIVYRAISNNRKSEK
jgi:hypothetical protein